jgi:hypothetical protein
VKADGISEDGGGWHGRRKMSLMWKHRRRGRSMCCGGQGNAGRVVPTPGKNLEGIAVQQE